MMEAYIWISLLAALALSLSALIGKILLRYRICSAGLVTWGGGAVISVLSLALCLSLKIPFPLTHWVPVASLAAVLLIATRLLNQALQEGDASTVVPLLGLKIPFSSILAWALLGESVSAIVWLAVLCSAGAVALFGMGPQQKAQGGHGHQPRVAIIYAVFAALLFSVADIIARTGTAELDTRALLLWSNVLWGPVSAVALMAKRYRKYRVAPMDVGLWVLGNALVVVALLSLYHSFKVAGSVILPNVIMGTRGVFAVIAGYMLSKIMRVPMERQNGSVYLCRAIGTLLLIATLVMVNLGGGHG